MKRLLGIIVVVAFGIFAVADTIHDFIANDTVHYFSEQPDRLLLVAAIAIVGGLIVFCFCLLSPRLQRRVRLLTLGSVASFVMIAGGYFALRFWRLPAQMIPRQMSLYLLLFTVTIAAMIWFEFYQVLTTRDHMTEPDGQAESDP